ncbi:hypothetical protein CSB93_3637 [Pseudomonas paraeruginosa]|uniref:Uncharacterized protein n=1 Tax=Pseudomonas paraeruginosa TaxID=2994495 RepID=A0A2R3IYX8_9PSED|nr:hypothetical protein CSB93_3637 [Pseudomonas paraeruginosa]
MMDAPSYQQAQHERRHDVHRTAFGGKHVIRQLRYNRENPQPYQVSSITCGVQLPWA